VGVDLVATGGEEGRLAKNWEKSWSVRVSEGMMLGLLVTGERGAAESMGSWRVAATGENLRVAAMGENLRVAATGWAAAAGENLRVAATGMRNI
jgi:hypothetical protein